MRDMKSSVLINTVFYYIIGIKTAHFDIVVMRNALFGQKTVVPHRNRKQNSAKTSWRAAMR